MFSQAFMSRYTTAGYDARLAPPVADAASSVSPRRQRHFASRNRNTTPFEDIRPPSNAGLALVRRTAARFQEISLSSVMVGLVLSLHAKKVA